MRALTILPLTAAFAFAFAFAFAERDLSISTWGEYTPPDLIAKFEMEFGVKVHIDSLSILDPAQDVKGRINMLRDMNDVINLAERYLGVPRCSESPEDMKRVLDLLETQKEWVKSYDSETKELLVSGEAVGSVTWNGYAMRVRDEKPPISYVYPVEGYAGWIVNLAVVTGAPNLETAKAFINFAMAPENAAMITN